MKYRISTDPEDRIALENLDKTNSIIIGSNKINIGSNSSCVVNEIKVVSKNGKIYVNGKLVEQEGQRYAYRIIALEDIKDKTGKVIVKAGQKGGYVESEENLSQEGTCWIYNDAKVIDDAKVSGSAQIRNHATIRSGARVGDNAIISDHAQIYNKSRISGNAKVYGNAEVYNHTTVSDNAEVFGNAEVYNHVQISGRAKIYGNAEVYNNTTVSDNAEVFDNAEVYSNVHISKNAKIYDKAEVHDDVEITDDVKVCKNAEICGDTRLTGNQCIKKSINTKKTDEIIINGTSISISGSIFKKDRDNKYKLAPYRSGKASEFKARNQSQFLEDFERE